MNRRRFLEAGIGGAAVLSRSVMGGPVMPSGIKLGCAYKKSNKRGCHDRFASQTY